MAQSTSEPAAVVSYACKASFIEGMRVRAFSAQPFSWAFPQRVALGFRMNLLWGTETSPVFWSASQRFWSGCEKSG